MATPHPSKIFHLDRQLVSDALTRFVSDSQNADEAALHRAKEILAEGWDLFMRVLSDGSIVISAVAVSKHPHPTSY
jgi:hypothetical protein